MAVGVLLLTELRGGRFAEAVEKSEYEVRWKVAWGLELEEVPMQKSALQEFEAKPCARNGRADREEVDRGGPARRIFAESQDSSGPGYGADSGQGSGAGTSNCWEKGSDVGRRLAEVEKGKEEITAWAEKQGLSRYLGSGLREKPGWTGNKGQREQLLTEIVQDGGAC